MQAQLLLFSYAVVLTCAKSQEAAKQTGISTTILPGTAQDGPASPTAAESQLTIFTFEQIGEPHAKPFSDLNFVDYGDRYNAIAFITLAGCEPGNHLRAIKIGLRDTKSQIDKATSAVQHGTSENEDNQQVLRLNHGEWVSEIKLSTYKAKTRFSRHTRIGWAKITSNVGQSIVCGGKGPNDFERTFAKEDWAFSFFSGSASQEVDALTAHFIPLDEYFHQVF